MFKQVPTLSKQSSPSFFLVFSRISLPLSASKFELINRDLFFRISLFFKKKTLCNSFFFFDILLKVQSYKQLIVPLTILHPDQQQRKRPPSLANFRKKSTESGTGVEAKRKSGLCISMTEGAPDESSSAPHMWTGRSALTEHVKTAGKFP